MEFYTKEDGYPISISIETMSVEHTDDDTCLYSSVVMDMETNKVIAEFCHDSVLGRRKWAEGFFAGLKHNKETLKHDKKILKDFATWLNQFEELGNIFPYLTEYLKKK